MKVAMKKDDGKIVISPKRNTIMRYAGKLHKKYNEKKINIDKVRDVIVYSDI